MGSTPITGTTPNGSQTLDIAGFVGFSLCSIFSYVCPSLISKFAVFGLIFGGTLEGHSTLSGGIYAQNRIGRRNLWSEIQVRVNVWGGRNVAVTQPLLNFFQAYTVCVQQACTAMPQIMKANLPHTVLLQNQRKMLCEISGLHKFTDLVDIDIIGVFFAIGTPA